MTLYLIRGNGQIVYYEGWCLDWGMPYLGSYWWFGFCCPAGRDGA